MTSSKRTAPDDINAIVLSYHHEHPWWYGPDDGLQMWHVSADVRDEVASKSGHVGDLYITLVGDEVEDPFALLDGWDAELGRIAEEIFDVQTGELTANLDEQLEPIGGAILILHNAKFSDEWRGFGLGPLLAGVAIKRLSNGVRAAVCYPAPLNETDGADDGYDEAAWDRGVAALQRTWSKLGFEHFREGVYVLDLSLVIFEQRLNDLVSAVGQIQLGSAAVARS